MSRPSWDAGLAAWQSFAVECGVDPEGVPRGQLRRRLWHSQPAEDKPAGNATRDEWAAYAQAHGVDPEGLSRNDIRDRFAD